MAYGIGVDFGTASARTLLLDLVSGQERAVCELAYPHGVIDDMVPETGQRLPLDWALHDPDDYLTVLEKGISTVLSEVPGAAREVIGIGLDATCCTVLPATTDGEPLCRHERWRPRPHSWVKLWKHHAAQPVATRLNEVALERKEPFLARYGGRISSEWYFPKLIEIWLDDRELYDATDSFVEVADWVVWQLSGNERRSACPAAYKALWSPDVGLPSREYFEAAYPGFADPWAKLGKDFHALGTSAGPLTPEWASRLGLAPGVAVAVGNVDSFVSFPGVGAENPGKFVMVIGTSICDMVVNSNEILLTGVTGVAKDGILPGLYGYEAGQPAVGDMLGWFAEKILQGSPDKVLPSLEREASRLLPGETGLLALDWWNGNRSILADADLSGVVAGFTLQTTQVELYRALLESIAYSTKAILDNFASVGLNVDEVVACGGIAEKSPFIMQLISDVSGLPVTVPASSQVPARGSALFGAVAAGAGRGGFGDIAKAARALRPEVARRYSPDADVAPVYAAIYKIWKDLHNMFGRDEAGWLHELKHQKRLAEARQDHAAAN
ncbi:MAG TPA: ribulokinase [Acidimicrobiales bacterium]|nr:ribulokinase [Acidimicrobiales bacterium]